MTIHHNQTINSDNQHIIGDNNTINGDNCNIIGFIVLFYNYTLTTHTYYTLILGNHNFINGDNCHIKGNHNTINGDNCYIIGDNNHAAGDNNHFKGSNNTSSGYNNIGIKNTNNNNNITQTRGNSSISSIVCGTMYTKNLTTSPNATFTFNDHGGLIIQDQGNISVIGNCSGIQHINGIPFNEFKAAIVASHNEETTTASDPLAGIEKCIAEETNEDNMTCSICLTNKKDVIFNCKHITCCVDCTKNLNPLKCPICRADITKAEKIYI